MQLLEVTEVQLQWDDLNNLTYHPRQQESRSGGEHVSDVLKVLREFAISKNMYTEEDKEDDMPLRILLGLAFEESAARLYPTMHWQPGEIEYAGLAGSPDGISPGDTAVYPDGICVDEFKYTGKSLRIKGRKPQPNGQIRQEDLKDIRSEFLWIHQGMTYINLLRRSGGDAFKKLNLCRFHICWKYGAYQYPMREVYIRYLVRFDEKELNGSWAMVQAFRSER